MSWVPPSTPGDLEPRRRAGLALGASRMSSQENVDSGLFLEPQSPHTLLSDFAPPPAIPEKPASFSYVSSSRAETAPPIPTKPFSPREKGRSVRDVRLSTSREDVPPAIPIKPTPPLSGSARTSLAAPYGVPSLKPVIHAKPSCKPSVKSLAGSSDGDLHLELASEAKMVQPSLSLPKAGLQKPTSSVVANEGSNLRVDDSEVSDAFTRVLIDHTQLSLLRLFLAKQKVSPLVLQFVMDWRAAQAEDRAHERKKLLAKMHRLYFAGPPSSLTTMLPRPLLDRVQSSTFDTVEDGEGFFQVGAFCRLYLYREHWGPFLASPFAAGLPASSNETTLSPSTAYSPAPSHPGRENNQKPVPVEEPGGIAGQVIGDDRRVSRGDGAEAGISVGKPPVTPVAPDGEDTGKPATAGRGKVDTATSISSPLVCIGDVGTSGSAPPPSWSGSVMIGVDTGETRTKKKKGQKVKVTTRVVHFHEYAVSIGEMKIEAHAVNPSSPVVDLCGAGAKVRAQNFTMHDKVAWGMKTCHFVKVTTELQTYFVSMQTRPEQQKFLEAALAVIEPPGSGDRAVVAEAPPPTPYTDEAFKQLEMLLGEI